jgi:hypothetical protein
VAAVAALAAALTWFWAVPPGTPGRSLTKVPRQFGWQLGGNSPFVLAGAARKWLVAKDGDVAERLKAAVC